MLYLLLPCAGIGEGRCCGDTGPSGIGLVIPGGVFVPLLPLGDPFRPSFEIVRLDKEWLRVVGAVDAEFRVELDLVVGAFPLDLLSSEALSW